jgi:hypothetical protein
MASGLPPSRYQSENDLRVLRKVIRWQSLGYDSKMRCGMLSLTHPSDFIYFSSYALVGLMPPLSSFFLMLLEHYGLQLQHLSPQSPIRLPTTSSPLQRPAKYSVWTKP